ncbi:hypothetical protein GCM10017668_19340 [Streptomyces tuirus]|uniref:Uncharacterized protein n=1 Tax=Streptomyces tuirus TaxID=68278 RepID=A0A7G1NBJ2_9ACTN|nr:hypothetical protein GCM10017668_19340 [Streptomyces tuirus]
MATPALDGWPSPRLPRGNRGTEPGVQPDSSAAPTHPAVTDLGRRTAEGISDALEWDVADLSPEQIKKFVAEAYRHA